MTKMFEYGGIVIYVYPKDHTPVHRHVFIDQAELRVFLPGYEIELKSGKMPNTKILKKIKEAVAANRHTIGKEWRKFHGN